MKIKRIGIVLIISTLMIVGCGNKEDKVVTNTTAEQELTDITDSETETGFISDTGDVKIVKVERFTDIEVQTREKETTTKEETTTKKQETTTKKQETTTNTTIYQPEQTTPQIIYVEPTTNSTTVQQTTKVEETTVQIKELGTQNETNVLSNGKVGTIRSSITDEIGSSENKTCKNLAKYCSANKTDDVNGVYTSLTNDTSKSFKIKYIQKTISDSSDESIIDAATTLAQKVRNVSNNKYGVGISSFNDGNNILIIAVVVYE